MIDEGPSQDDIDRFSRETARCPECGREVYDDLPRCPHCQSWLLDRSPAAGIKRWHQWVIGIIALLVLLGLLLRAAF